MTRSLAIPKVLSREQVREVDRRALSEFGLSGLVLMENAGRNSAQLLSDIGINGSVVICCGKGNNGGDGFVIARHLENANYKVRVVLCVLPADLTGDAATNFQILQKSRTPVALPPIDWKSELAAADWIVDALLGTGTQGTIREPYLSAVKAINDSGRRTFAVDLPSGLDCDTGIPLGECVRASHTATFVARKPGFNVPGVERFTGKIHVIDIGVPRALLLDMDHPPA